jgi:hypothetical protein
MAVPVIKAAGATFEVGTPVASFQTRILDGGSVGTNRPNYDVSREGRFLIAQALEEASISPITLILNPNLGEKN